MAKRIKNIPLWLRLLLRRLRSPEGRLAPLAVLSIAISVTLATGLEMSSRSAQRQLEVNAEAISGAAELEVVAGSVGVAEGLLEVVRGTPGVLAASPLVSVKLRLSDQSYALNVIGVDLLAEEQVRKTAIDRNGLQIRDPLRLLATPNSVVVTEPLLERLGLLDRYRSGLPVDLPVRTDSGETSLVVQGLLQPTGLAAAFSGQVVLMDVYSAQLLSGRRGVFDRIDVVPMPGQNRPALMATLRDRLAGVATVQASSTHSRSAEDLLQMVRRSALILAAAAALVAALLTYATTAQWVDRQKRQLATLRAVGMEAGRVQRAIFAEVAALAGAGTLVGMIGGMVISPLLLAVISKFLEVVAVEELTTLSVQASTFTVAIATGVAAGVAGSVLPARRAGRRYTLDSLETSNPAGTRARGLLPGASALGVFLVIAMTKEQVLTTEPMARLCILFFSGMGAVLCIGAVLPRVFRVVLHPVEDAFPAMGHLVTRFFGVRPWTFSVALVAISTLVSALVTVFLLIETIAFATDRWTEARYPTGAILVSPAPFMSTLRSEVLSSSTLAQIRATPGVIAVDEQYRNQPTILFRGRTVPLAAYSMEVVAKYGHIASVGRASADLANDLHAGAIAVSTGFAKTFGVGAGDEVELDTRSGARRFLVAGVFEDFGDASGSILLDIATYDSAWTRPGAWSATIWVDGEPAAVMDEIRRSVGSQDLFFADAGQIAASNRRRVEVFTSTLHVLGAFISSLGGIGVMVLLAGIVAERRHDLAVLRAAGTEPGRLVILVLLDAIVLGVVGAALGLAIGFACASPAADILRESYGWILEQRWTAPELPTVALGAVLSAVLGALLPAWTAYRTAPQGIFGPE